MSEPQAILTPPTTAAIFLVATVDVGGEQQAVDLLADLAGLRRSVGFRVPEAGLTCVAGVGAEVWERLFAAPKPRELHPFRRLEGRRHTAPATDGDLLFHIRAQRLDLCFELAQQICTRLTGAGRVLDEVHGFRSFDQRDLLGFVDGTENPEGEEAREAVVIGDDDPGLAGGSYVVVQKYLHDLQEWNALSVEQQERAVGRTKLSDVELPDEAKPPNSHLALNTIVDEDGEEQQIFRVNMPFGRAGEGEYGTYYIAYARSPAVIEEMLVNMFIGKPAGVTDRLLDFSTAMTGNLFFVPPASFLDDTPFKEPVSGAAGVEGSPDPERGPGPQSGAADGSPESGSLQIGSLKERL